MSETLYLPYERMLSCKRFKRKRELSLTLDSFRHVTANSSQPTA